MCFIHDVRSEVVQQGAEGQPIPPRGGEVGDLHPAVVLGDLAAPDQQRLAGVGLSSQNWTRDGAGLQAERRKRRRRDIEKGRWRRQKTKRVLIQKIVHTHCTPHVSYFHYFFCNKMLT